MGGTNQGRFTLPSIRKHGGYLTSQKLEEALLNPDTIIKLATDLKEEREQRAALEQEKTALSDQIELDRHKVVFAESIEVAQTSILVREMAKLIQQATGYKIGEKRLFIWLRDNGYLIKARGTDFNMPTQKSMDKGLFEIKEGSYVGSSGTHITKTAKVTGKGQTYFIAKFLKLMKNETTTTNVVTPKPKSNDGEANHA